MLSGEIEAVLRNVANAELEIKEASGMALLWEYKMRFIGELSSEVRKVLTRVIERVEEEVNKKRKNKKKYKIDRREYSNCDLEYLEEAIDKVLCDELEESEYAKFKNFRQLRNKLLHANFIAFMEKLGISPTSREIISGGKQKLLNKKDENIMRESLLSASRNQAFVIFVREAKDVEDILNKLIRSF